MLSRPKKLWLKKKLKLLNKSKKPEDWELRPKNLWLKLINL